MLDDLILFKILLLTMNPWDFINFLICISSPADVMQRIEYFVKTKQFMQILWMYNLGILTRYIYSIDEIIIKDNAIFVSYGYDDEYDIKPVHNRFFSDLRYIYFDCSIDDEGYKTLIDVFKYDIYNINESLETRQLNDKFSILYKTHAKAFLAGFDVYQKRIRFLEKSVLTVDKIYDYVKRNVYTQSTYVLDEPYEKEDHHASNKYYKRSKYDSKKKEKIKRKNRSSPKSTRRHEKYGNKIDYFV